MSDADTLNLMLDLALDSPDDVRLLRGALLAARASELAEARRRGARHAFGYGTESQRESMTAEAAHADRRRELLDRLIDALDRAANR